MIGVPRSARLLLAVLLLVIVSSLYFLHPHHDPARSPGDQVTEYEAGGIDSPHWREPIKPDFEREELRWTPEEEAEEASQGRLETGVQGGVKDGPYHESGGHRGASQGTGFAYDGGITGSGGSPVGVGEDTLNGGVIMPRLGNATAKCVPRHLSPGRPHK